jgi:hypothetical protein
VYACVYMCVGVWVCVSVCMRVSICVRVSVCRKEERREGGAKVTWPSAIISRYSDVTDDPFLHGSMVKFSAKMAWPAVVIMPGT